MTVFYVRKSGSDGAAGTSPAAAWATIGKALGASGITYGDTVYIGAGTYREAVDVALADGSHQYTLSTTSGVTTINDFEFVTADVGYTIEGPGIPAGTTVASVVNNTSGTLSAAPTTTETNCPFYLRNPAQNVETFVIGDVDGVMTGDAGEVRWTNHVTNDTTAPTGQTLDLKGRSYLTFRRINFVGYPFDSTKSTISLDPSSSKNPAHITFTDCSIRGLVWAGGFPIFAGINNAWLFDRCFMVSTGEVFEAAGNRKSTLDWDVGIAFRNCVIVSFGEYRGIYLDAADTGGRPGGMQFLNCSLFGRMQVADDNWSTSVPMLIKNCVLAAAPLIAATSGQIVEDYNVFVGGRSSSNVNVSSGAHSTAYAAPLFSLGDESVWGAIVRAFGMPMAGSPALAFGGSSPQTVDILGAPRVAALAAAGAYERGNTFVKETGTVRSGSNAISITGPGYQDWRVRVDPVSTTLTVYVRWESPYAGTKPKMQVLAGTECGVADATATATGSAGAWEQLTLTFTPTAAGIVKVRFLSSDTNGAGKMIVDDFLRAP